MGCYFTTLYNVVDVYYAGLLSTDAQAGLAIGYQAFFILMAVGFGLSSALSTLVSNAKGSGDAAEAQRYVVQGLAFGVGYHRVMHGDWLVPRAGTDRLGL